jgi:hypothetical protein
MNHEEAWKEMKAAVSRLNDEEKRNLYRWTVEEGQLCACNNGSSFMWNGLP